MTWIGAMQTEERGLDWARWIFFPPWEESAELRLWREWKEHFKKNPGTSSGKEVQDLACIWLAHGCVNPNSTRTDVGVLVNAPVLAVLLLD